MNVKYQLILLGLLGSALSLAAEDFAPVKGVISLKNGTELTGTIKDAAADTLDLKPYWSTNALAIPFSAVRRFSRENLPERLMREGVLLHFRNENRLQLGDLRFDGLRFSGTSAWGETVVIPDSAVDHIRFFDSANVRYTGPESATKLGGRSRLWLSGEIEWPEKFLLEAYVEKSTEDVVYQMTLMEEQSRRPLMMSRRMVLEFAERNINAAWYLVENQNRISSNNWRGQLFDASRIQVIRLYGDFATQTFTLYVNDQKIKSWASHSNQTAAPTEALPVTFRLNSEGELAIRSLRVMKWDGQVFGEAMSEKGMEKRDWIFFTNGQVQAGELLGIDENGLKWVSPAGATPRIVPRNEVLVVQRPRMLLSELLPVNQGAVHIRTLGVEDQFQVDLERITEGRLYSADWPSGDTPAFSIPLQAVKAFWLGEEDTP